MKFKKKQQQKINLKTGAYEDYTQLPSLGEQAAGHAAVMAGDLWHALRTERTFQIMMILALVCLFCWNLPPISFLLYPFKLFVTVVHEACHALAAIVTGGRVGFITISPNESGLTGTYGGIRFIVAQAGYIGTAVFGGFLIWLGKRPSVARVVLQIMGAIICGIAVVFGWSNPLSMIMMLAIGAGMFYFANKSSPRLCHMFLLMLAVITTLSSVMSIQDLFIVSSLGGASDATNMQNMTGIPAFIWCFLWGIIAVAVLVFSLWFSYRKKKYLDTKDLMLK
jgi:hypothetical protein